MKYTLRFTGEFKRSLKTCLKRGYKEELLTEALNILVNNGHLPERYSPHLLHGNYEGYWGVSFIFRLAASLVTK